MGAAPECREAFMATVVERAGTENPWAGVGDLNLAYLLDLYDTYHADPASVPPAVRAQFDQWGPPPAPAESGAASPGGASSARHAPAQPSPTDFVKVAAAMELAVAIRSHGHRAAHLDPLGSEPPGDAALLAETHGIREEDLAELPASIVGGPLADRAGNALAAIRHLRKVYQGSTGYEFEHVSNSAERQWLRSAVESGEFRPPKDPINELALLKRLTEVGALERFLQTAFTGQTRFSLEGLGIMVPVLDEIVGAAAEAGTRSVMLGMAHRGRLNVLAHVLGKPYEELIGEFMGRHQRDSVSIRLSSRRQGSGDTGFTGDVKYHLGARRAFKGGQAVDLTVVMIPNPSHLEWVNPVVEGITRASDERRDQPGPAIQDELASLAVLIHGDAAFPGQGIVAETLNLSRLPGYRTGGTLHIIANNQLGFTTTPASGRSTLYASDLAKGFEIPVIHVNADDVEACVAAARLAHAYRERFRSDVVLDLIGYRRWGHNEGDEPAFTQPVLYKTIAEHPRVRKRWANELVRRGLITEQEAEGMLQAAIEHLHSIRQQLLNEPKPDAANGRITSGFEAGGQQGGYGHQGVAAEIRSALPAETVTRLNRELYTFPAEFNLHPKLEKSFARRRDGLGVDPDLRVDWAHAEALAFASVLAEGMPIRLTGQDVSRGTFSQRHAQLFDAVTGQGFVPLQAIPSARASFQIWDSPLSEQATLGFEFGYSAQAPEAMVLWEAQYGDFVNVPQAIIDQSIVSARNKWDQVSAVVMLLPHGYEGAGPEHSSARLERFLQMAAEDNVRIANCTTAAQYYHLLRRHAHLLKEDPRPLIVFSPKSLLRNPLATSRFEDLVEGEFMRVLDDDRPITDPGSVRRAVFCSGKVYQDLYAAREKVEGPTHFVSVHRVEELYPFPAEAVSEVIQGFPNLEEVVWLQEEPRNMGAWTYVAPKLRDITDNLRPGMPLRYIGRTRRASPSEGSHGWHLKEQNRLVAAALAPLCLEGYAPDGSKTEGEADVALNGMPARAPRRRTRKEVEHAG